MKRVLYEPPRVDEEVNGEIFFGKIKKNHFSKLQSFKELPVSRKGQILTVHNFFTEPLIKWFDLTSKPNLFSNKHLFTFISYKL